jgi:hypothetical protein
MVPEEWIWKELILGKLVITGNIQNCQVTLKDSWFVCRMDMVPMSDWALDFLELKRLPVA